MRTVLFIFSELTDQDVDWMTANGAKKAYRPGEVLIQKDVPNKALFVILTGEFAVWIDDKREVSRAGTGEMLGEMSLLEARPPVVSVKAAVDSEALMISHDKIQEKIRQDPSFAGRLYKALAMLLSFRLRRLTYRVHGGPDEEGSADELDGNILDTVFLAGARFDRMIKRLT